MDAGSLVKQESGNKVVVGSKYPRNGSRFNVSAGLEGVAFRTAIAL
jgi:hypothetical protein